MLKLVCLLSAAALGLSGCATTANLTPCEKAILAKYAADKIIGAVCPLSEPAPEGAPQADAKFEGVY